MEQQGGFSLAYFVQVFQEIKQTPEGVRPSFSSVCIRQGGSGPNAGKPVYTSPRGEGILEAKLSNLVDFLNDDRAYPLDPLLKMAIGHYQFEAIHPFWDGNGRTGRVANIHVLTQKGLLDYPILYLSRYIVEHKQKYCSALAGVSQRGDWSGCFQRFKAQYYIEQILINGALTGAVVFMPQLVQQFVDIFFGPLHGLESTGIFTG